MATTESFRELLKLLIVQSKIIGVEIWTAPGKFRPASYYLSFQVLVYFICNIYSLSKYSSDTVQMMKILITLGSCVQLYIKFFVGHWKCIQFQSFTNFVEEGLLKPYQFGSHDEVAILQRTGRILKIVLRMLCVTFLSSGVCFGLYPVYVYYTSGVVMPLFLYELPYYDWSTAAGYVVNMLFQVNLYIIGIVGATLSNFLFFMNAMYAMAHGDIFMVHLRELEAMLNDSELMDKDMSAVCQKWMQCMYDHQQSVSGVYRLVTFTGPCSAWIEQGEASFALFLFLTFRIVLHILCGLYQSVIIGRKFKFFDSIEEMYRLVCLVQVSMGVFSICDIMLLVTLTDWYAAYFFLLAVFMELSIYFVIGHFVEIKVDEMYETIISMSWYKLPISSQNDFSFLLCRQQRPMILTICNLAPLNFSTYMSVLRGLYQFFVMTMQYVG